ncbi:MAG TPA: DUF4390 domain-containing protein [Vicinamibacterales bacterium]|nr:DUF4390 domain-containing protein [Vicinamibacterales bacterium]
MTARVLTFVLVLMAAAASAFALEQTMQIVPLPRDGELLVSFKLGQPLTDDIRAAIQSGLTIKFVYKVDLRRGASVWFDRTIASAVVTATVKYDTLTRTYHITRMVDGRTDYADTTLDEETAWAALTSDFARMSLFHGVPLEPNAEYYVRVRANSSPKNSTFIWPWQADDAVGLAKFTFIR